VIASPRLTSAWLAFARICGLTAAAIAFAAIVIVVFGAGVVIAAIGASLILLMDVAAMVTWLVIGAARLVRRALA
jgi:hypothetical protein